MKGLSIGMLVVLVVLVVLGAGALFTQGAANFQTARAATEAARAAKAATATTLVGGLLVGGLSVTLLASMVVIAYLVFQLRATERGQALRFPRQRKRLDGPVVYILETSPDDADERHPMEVIEWTNDDWRF